MSWEMRKEFLKQFTFGVMAKFEENFLTFLKTEKRVVLESVNVNSITSPTQQLLYTKPIIDVKAILNRTPSGKEILSFNGAALNNTLKNLLVDKIVENMINDNIKMSVQLAENISEQIIKLFPHEKKVINNVFSFRYIISKLNYFLYRLPISTKMIEINH